MYPYILGYEIKTCISEGREIYSFQERGGGDAVTAIRNEAFPESLISFLYLNLEEVRPLFQRAADALFALNDGKSEPLRAEILNALYELAGRHIYFEQLCLDWRYRIDRAFLTDCIVDNILERGAFSRIPDTLQRMQGQIFDLFTHVLEPEDGAVMEHMTIYYRAALEENREVFSFQPQPMSFELLSRETFAEVLCPQSIYDLIDFHVRECVKRKIKMRRCKNCGRYFAVTGHGGTEYCGRPIEGTGRTCREAGAVAVWERSKQSDRVFLEYRREYKKRFAWIRSGRTTQEAFYAWGERAREKKAECERGAISFDEFSQWLKESE